MKPANQDCKNHETIFLFRVIPTVTLFDTNPMVFVLKSGEDDEEGENSSDERALDFIRTILPFLVPSPGWGSSGGHCDLSGQPDNCYQDPKK